MKKVILGIIVLAAAYAGGVAYVAMKLHASATARAKQHTELAALGEKQQLDEGSALKEACAGKLQGATPYSFVEYVKQGELGGVLLRMNDSGGYLSTYRPDEPVDGPNFARAMSADDWGRLLDHAAEDQRNTDAVKYLLVAELSDLRPASANELTKTFDSGRSHYRARVLAWPSGEKVCEGSGEGHFDQKEVIGHGGSSEDARSAMLRKLEGAWKEATQASPLDDLCEAGGKDLCSATDLATNAPDW